MCVCVYQRELAGEKAGAFLGQPAVFYFLPAELEQQRKWEGVASFFGIARTAC